MTIMSILRIGITGQAGFIGTHLFNTLGLHADDYKRISFQDEYFESDETLDSFVQQCDVIVHLAAVNRHADINVLYETNIGLVQKLIGSMERTNCTPYVIMSSSLQEERDNLYGKSKHDGRLLFNEWAERNDTAFTGLIIPNVFGPFGVPYYNSVISTFSYQIIIGEEPKIEVDGLLNLIYVGDLVSQIMDFIMMYRDKDLSSDAAADTRTSIPSLFKVPHTAQHKVSDLLHKLRSFHETYVVNGVFPDFTDWFDVCLFNTFRSYIPSDHFPVSYKKHSDPRGVYVEAVKFLSGGQTAFSTTVPGITRGNHFHTRKVERFAVIQGKASIKLRKYGSDEVVEYLLDGSDPSYVDMSIWFTHNITNIGDTELLTLFWINEFYDPKDPDTFFEEV